MLVKTGNPPPLKAASALTTLLDHKADRKSNAFVFSDLADYICSGFTVCSRFDRATFVAFLIRSRWCYICSAVKRAVSATNGVKSWFVLALFLDCSLFVLSLSHTRGSPSLSRGARLLLRSIINSLMRMIIIIIAPYCK